MAPQINDPDFGVNFIFTEQLDSSKVARDASKMEKPKLSVGRDCERQEGLNRLWGRGEREFPFPTIPGNTSLPFPFPKVGNGFFIPIPVPKSWE